MQLPLDPSKIPEIAPSPTDQGIAEAEKDAFLFALECDAIEETLEGQRQDRIERKKYAAGIFKVLVWLWIGIFALITLQGFSNACPQKFFELPANILNILATGASVFSSVFTFVIRYLFSSSPKPKVASEPKAATAKPKRKAKK